MCIFLPDHISTLAYAINLKFGTTVVLDKSTIKNILKKSWVPWLLVATQPSWKIEKNSNKVRYFQLTIHIDLNWYLVKSWSSYDYQSKLLVKKRAESACWLNLPRHRNPAIKSSLNPEIQHSGDSAIRV